MFSRLFGQNETNREERVTKQRREDDHEVSQERRGTVNALERVQRYRATRIDAARVSHRKVTSG